MAYLIYYLLLSTDPKKAAGVLQQVVAEMERRYEVFADNGQRNMESYNIYARTFNEKANDEDKKEIMLIMLLS